LVILLESQMQKNILCT